MWAVVGGMDLRMFPAGKTDIEGDSSLGKAYDVSWSWWLMGVFYL